jgi:tetratricopeptide (TPR) repeat protein
VYGFLLDVASIPRAIFDNPRVGRFFESDFVRRIAEFLGVFFQISFFQPVKWLAAIAGMAMTWVMSRDWGKTVLMSLPTMLMLLTMGLIVRAGMFNKEDMASEYLRLGLAELEAQKKLSTSESSPQPVDLTDQQQSILSSTQDTDQPKDPEGQKISSYAELLFRRAQVLHPQSQSAYIIGATLLQEGAIEAGQKKLKNIAPDNRRGHPDAHAALATSYLNEFLRTKDMDILPTFLHHAGIAEKLPNTPIEVLIGASEVLWSQGDLNRSLEFVETAARRNPSIYLRLMQLAKAAGDQRLDNLASRNYMIFLRQVLAKDPTNDKARVQIVQMLGTSPEALMEAESLLREGLDIQPTRVLLRALSEVYRILFVRQMIESKESIADLNLLSDGMQTDPTNPLIADQIENLINSVGEQASELQQLLNNVLISGAATNSAHATLAELYMKQQKPKQALLHLEQLYMLEPMAIKYANALTRIYLEQGRLDDAVRTARNSVELLANVDMLKERYASDLLEALGMALEKLGETPQAIAAYKDCIQYDSKRIETRKRLAGLYRMSGQEKEAQEEEAKIAELEASEG